MLTLRMCGIRGVGREEQPGGKGERSFSARGSIVWANKDCLAEVDGRVGYVWVVKRMGRGNLQIMSRLAQPTNPGGATLQNFQNR